MRKLLALSILAGSMTLSNIALLAQQPSDAASGQSVTDQDIQLLRSDLRSQKKQLIAQNMQLTDAQAQKFWPVYDAYAVETTKLSDTRYALIKELTVNDRLRELVGYRKRDLLGKNFREIFQF